MNDFKVVEPLIGGAVLALLATSDAFAADGAPPGPSEAIFFAQVGILLVVGRLLGEVMQRIGQPAVIGQLVAGIMLGPTVLGVLWPDPAQHGDISRRLAEQRSMIDAVSPSSAFSCFVMLTGMETDLSWYGAPAAPAITVSAAGVAVPLRNAGVGAGRDAFRI